MIKLSLLPRNCLQLVRASRKRFRECMPIWMQTTTVHIDTNTHGEPKRLAAELNTTVGSTVSLAVKALRQDRVGADLSTPLRDELAWLDADRG